MDPIRNSCRCRLCLKLTNENNLTPLFDDYKYEFGENVAMEWRRMFSFIYNIQGLPDKICNNCKAQAEWILTFQRQCYENDASLRFNHQIKTVEHEFLKQQDALSNIYDNEASNNKFHETQKCQKQSFN